MTDNVPWHKSNKQSMSTNNEADCDCCQSIRLRVAVARWCTNAGNQRRRSERKLSRQRVTCGQPLNELAWRRPTK